MLLYKSDKARLELQAKARGLGMKERQALFLADGERTHGDLQEILQDDGSILRKLIAQGYLTSSNPSAVLATPVEQNVPLVQRQTAPLLSTPPENSVDQFEGKRSLATTRMFLFDICERMFVRKFPDMATHYRDQLREARNRVSMLAIAQDMLMNVEEIAGPERADGLRERIAMLLPSEI